MENRSSLLRRLLTNGQWRPLPEPPEGVRPSATAAAFDFDQLARDLAAGLSRRQALRRIGQGLAATLLTALSLERAWGQGNSHCAHFCTSIYPPGALRGHCISDAAHGTGLCYQCGPAAPAGHGPVCGTLTNRFCCRSDQQCVQGRCVCPLGYHECAGQCCPPDQYCCNEQCSICRCDETFCSGSQGDDCCAAGETCCDGICCSGARSSCVNDICCIPAGAAAGCSDGDCCAGSTCVSGRCVKPSGSTCESHLECPFSFCTGGVCCIPAGFGPVGCVSDNDCCAGSTCVNGSCGKPSGDTCQTGLECHQNFPCIDGVCCIPAGGSAFARCESDADCCAGLTCYLPGNLGVCLAPRGASCFSDLQCLTFACVNNVCCIPEGQAFCNSDSDCCAGLTCDPDNVCRAPVIGP